MEESIRAGQVPLERIALALAVSASLHATVLVNIPLAPLWQGAAAGAAPRRLEVRVMPDEALREKPANPAQSSAEPDPPAAASIGATGRSPGLPAAEFYYRGSEVDERAMPLNEVNLVYPERALVSGQSGVVTLRLKIDHQGVLRDAAVVAAQPAGIFENAAMEAVRELKFRPAMRNGVPVGSLKTIEVPFYPDCTRTGSCIAGAADGAAPR